MAHFNIILFVILVSGWTGLAEETGSDTTLPFREPRHLGARRRCKKYGICPGQSGGYGGQGGGYGGQGGGYQGYPPINIGISQSQSSANAGGGGYGHGQYPNNYQYNGNYGGYGNRPHVQYPGYAGNGHGYNQQFNGNYYSPNGGYGGYQGYPGYQGGYQGGYPYGGGYQGLGAFGNNGGYFDEPEQKPVVEHSDYNEHFNEHDNGGTYSYAESRSAAAGLNNKKN